MTKPPAFSREIDAGHRPRQLALCMSLAMRPAHDIGFMPIEGSLQFYYVHGLLPVTQAHFPPRR